MPPAFTADSQKHITSFYDNRLLVLSPTLVSDDYAPQRVGHALLPGPTTPMVTELLQLPVPGYGTGYRHISEMLTYHIVASGGY